MLRLSGLLGLLAMLSPSMADAQCTSSTPSPGVEARLCEEGGVRYHIVRADLAAGDIGLRVSRPAEQAQAIETWAGSVTGAVFALQAGDFRFPSYSPRGLTVGEGEDWASADDGSHAVLGFDDRGVGVFVPATQVVPYEAWMASVVSGVPVLRAGVPVDECSGSGCERRSRTGLGIDVDGRFLVGVVAEGDRPGSAGVTDPELGALLRDAGALDGLRSAEGATSSLWLGGSISSPSSDGTSRPAAAFLAAVDRASGLTTRFRGVIGVEGRPEEFLPDAAITVEALDGRVVASGSPVTDGGYWEFSLPVREYIVRASFAGYRTGCKVCVGVASEDVWCSLFLAPGEGADECTPPPRTLDVGPWPDAPPDAGADAGPDAGMPGSGGGCAVGGAGGAGLFVLLFLVLRRRSG